MTDQGETAMPTTASAIVESSTLQGGADPEKLFQLGMMYASGRSVPADVVSAHKWFNIAALRGNVEAARLRREIAEEMSEAEIAAAQRAARDWITRH
jgi:TPR repeat protein